MHDQEYASNTHRDTFTWRMIVFIFTVFELANVIRQGFVLLIRMDKRDQFFGTRK
jgi:hypothetical protein